MKFTRITLKPEKHILNITLARPEQRNAFDGKMIKELTAAFAGVGKRSTERVVVLSGEGTSFCAGADLDWMKDSIKLRKAQNVKEAGELFEMFRAVRNCELPVVTCVHGHAMGGGLGLVAASDIVLAETDTQFCFSEVRLGLVPAVISSFVLSRGISSRVAPLMLTGQLFKADEAREAGLVNFVGRELENRERLNAILGSFAKSGPEAVRATKKLIRGIAGQPEAKIKKLCTETIAKHRTGAEGQEGLKAFLNKSKAKWVLTDESKN